MNYRRKALLLSLGVHALLISLLFMLSSALTHTEKPVVIDFTLAKPGARSSPPGAKKQKKPEKQRVAKHFPVSAPKKQKTTPPTPASERQNTVPVFKEERESSSQTTIQTAEEAETIGEGMTSGTGTSGFSPEGGTGTGETSEQLSEKYRAEHFYYIQRIIKKHLSYPKKARRMEWEGRVVVSFDVAKNGGVTEIRIIKSSGYRILDSNLVKTIRKVQPFPKPPIPITLKIPFVYKLKD